MCDRVLAILSKPHNLQKNVISSQLFHPEFYDFLMLHVPQCVYDRQRGKSTNKELVEPSEKNREACHEAPCKVWYLAI
jgi:hypothetical protein